MKSNGPIHNRLHDQNHIFQPAIFFASGMNACTLNAGFTRIAEINPHFYNSFRSLAETLKQAREC